jgi:hypothetical protein
MLEYAVGPVLALLISLKYTKLQVDKKVSQIDDVLARLEKVEKTVEVIDKETLKKMMITLTPVAKAVRELQEAIGIK